MAKKKRKLPRIRLKLVTWIALWLMAFLLPLAWMRVSQPEQTEAAWWNDAWHYRQRVDVTNNTSEEANVYIALTLDTSDTTKFQANCGDLRFTKQNGQVLEYYLVSGCGTASTSIHVQFDTFPAGAQSVYAYYGNGAAEDGFVSADFSTEASNYTIGGVASEEVGPGPVAYWKFDEASGSTAFDSASYATSDELLADADMELDGTSNWNPVNGTVSKENDGGNGKVLRLTETGIDPRIFVHSNFSPVVGKRYKFSGFMRRDGVNGTNLQFRDWAGGDVFLLGTSSSGEWEYFEHTFLAASSTIEIKTQLSSGYVEFDNMSVREVVSGNHGTINGATWASEDQCVSGKCLSFDGTDDYIASSDPGVTGTGAMSVSAWFRTTDTGSSDNTIIQWGTLSNGELFELNVESGVVWSRNYYNTVQAGSGYNDDQWHHLVLTKTADSTVAGISVYVDGQELETTTSGNDILNFGNSYPIRIGDANHDDRNFNGSLDEVKIFPYALSEDQIKTEYNLGSASIVGEAATVAPPPNGTLKDSLVAHWSFDEQAGQTVHDKVGGNDGTRGADANTGSDDPTWKPANECKVNGCLDFERDSAQEVISPVSVDSGLISVSAWIKPEAWNTGAWNSIFNSGGSFALRKDNSENMEFVVNISGWTGYGGFDISSVSPGKWHHIAATYDGDKVRLYLDGQLQSTDEATDGTLSSFGSVLIGEGLADGRNFDGLIDEVKIYNTALTADQVKQDMNAGAAIVYGVTANEADELSDGAGDPPVAEWKFDEKQGTTAYDTSGNENNGTITDATWKSACKQGACLEFDGGYVDIYSSSLASSFNTDQGTVTAWAKIDDSSIWTDGQIRYILEVGADDSNRVVLYKSSADNTLSGFSRFGGTIKDVSITTSTTDFFLLTLTWDKTADQVKVFLNGVQQGSTKTNLGTFSGSLSESLIGAGSTTPTYTWSGLIDHVRIYDYARTPAQIAYDYNRGKPIAHWKFDECEGTVAHDSSGNDSHGTINIGATGNQTTAGTCQTSGAWGNGASGKFNGSLNFDGTDDWVSMATNIGLKDEISFSAWVHPSTIDTRYRQVWSYDSDTEDRFFMMAVTSSAGGVEFTTKSGGAYKRAQASILPNQWSHIVGTAKAGDWIKIYVNGKEVSSVPITAFEDEVAWAPINDIGRFDNSGRYFAGQIDDARIYNYALSPAQIQKVMNEGMAVRYGPAVNN